MAGPAADVDVYLKQILQRMIETGEWQRYSLLSYAKAQSYSSTTSLGSRPCSQPNWTKVVGQTNSGALGGVRTRYFLRTSAVLNSLLELADEMNPLSIHDMLTDLNMNAHSTCLISLYESLLLIKNL